MPKNILKHLKKISRDPYSPYCTVEEIDTLFNRICDYWQVYDLAHGTAHHNIFRILYILNGSISYEKVAIKFNIEVRTVDRYVAKYNYYAQVLIENDYKNIRAIINKMY